MKTALKMFGSIAAVVAAALISQATAAVPPALAAPSGLDESAMGMSLEPEARPVCVNVACNFTAPPAVDCTAVCHQAAACAQIGPGTFRCVPE